jgi:Zn-finger nucleic acid-binding protein
MQKISREGVDIDICPSCKGVWLDRGELDKLLVAEREESEKSVQAHRRFQEEVKSFERNPNGSARTSTTTIASGIATTATTTMTTTTSIVGASAGAGSICSTSSTDQSPKPGSV